MKKLALLLFAWFGISVAVGAFAEDDFDLFTGLSLDSARSTQNGVKNSSAGLTGIFSTRYIDKHYGFEVQGGYFGKSGQFTSNVEADLCAIGLLPLGGSGINLYGKIGFADVFSTTSENNTGLTYGAGVEYQRNVMALRLGLQHFNVGGNTQLTSVRTNLIGIAVLVK